MITSPCPGQHGTMRVSIGVLSPDDWAILRRLRLAALHETFRHTSVYARELAFDEPRWRERAHEDTYFACAFDGTPVGLLAATWLPPGGGPGRIHLYSMWIDPAVRGRGLAGPLLRAALDWAGGQPAHTVTLRVDTDNHTARHVYEAAGFIASPARPDDGAGSMEMTLRLTPATRSGKQAARTNDTTATAT